MKKGKRMLSMMLTLCMILGMLPAGMFPAGEQTAYATDDYTDEDHMNDRTDVDMTFNYDYSDPKQKLSALANCQGVDLDSKTAGSITWSHITSFSPASGDLKNKLQSTAEADTYLVLDNDLHTTSAHTDFNTIVIKSNKVLDLNGHSINLFDKRNKVDTHDDYYDKYYQSDNANDFQTVMFSIQSGATLTIIDSSEAQTGEIYINAYMINPYAHRMKRYTTRDIFDVSDGNLVIYGGTFQAGRSKAQSDDDLFEKLSTVVGNAAVLATDIAGYATGINSATGAYEDAVFNAELAMKTIKNDTSDEGSKKQENAATVKKDGSDAEKEKKTDSPTSEVAGEEGGRNKTVGEKQEDKDKEKKNESNQKGTAQYDGNSKIAEAENAIVNAATNKDKITTMVNSVLTLAKSVKSCFETNEGSIVTQSFLGTVVNVGNGGTFVSYGGTYIGHGMTPNIRNGVVECTTMGKVYIYGGTFEGRAGANIFNIVKNNNSQQKVTQYVEDANGNVTEKTTYMNTDETNGLEVLSMVNKTDSKGNIVYDTDGNPVKVPVDTSNIKVRGGTFRCYYEGIMVGLNEDSKEGANDHNSDNMTVFPGSSGGVNLGTESYGDDLIRDGRIQIVDSYGDGALVLMDDDKEAGDKSIFHYRLFCTDEELRKNRYLVVYPNDADSNSTYSFSLQTRYGGQDASNFDDVAQYWSNEGENDRGVFSSDEQFFTYPINDKELSEKYYVIPRLTNTDVFGENLDTSEVWYYNTPTDTRGRKIDSFTYGYTTATGSYKTSAGGTETRSYQQNKVPESAWKKIEKNFISNAASYKQNSWNYRNTVKWITYKVYRVDPLTRENITTVFGTDQPVVEVCYGAASDTALKCRLPLDKLGIDYQAGEMYRVVMSIEEYLNYNGTSEKLDTAKCESSICFMCYDTDEYKITGKQKVEDYTPVQWVSEPQAGNTAMVQIVNGQAGKVDFQHRKIFDVYYQWYEVNQDGDDILIAGTDNIYTAKLDDYTANLAGLKSHNFRQMLPGIDGYTYVNTVDPSDPKAAYYEENGLPADTSQWTVQMLHAYIESNTPNALLAKNSAYDPTPQNNKAMATNIDSCYIPQEMEGKTIYCKVTAVNSYWMRNYDHIQVFYSHPVTLPIETKPLELTMDVSYNGDYVTKDNQATMKLSQIKGLDPDEKVTKVEFIAKRGITKTVTLENLNVVNASSVKSVTYPKDFYTGNTNLLGAYENIQLKAKIYTNKSRVAISNETPVDYEVPAEDLKFGYHSYYFYEGIYHHIDDYFVDEMSINVTPANASIGYSFLEGGSFTSSDPEVATFDGAGKLIPGTKEGRTTIVLTTPKGETKSLIYANPIQKVEITGIDAPVAGETFDLTGDVPTGANYTVKEVYWTEGKYGDRLPADAVAQMFHSYTAHVVVQENSGQEFNTDDYAYWVDGAYEHFVKVPYTMTVNLSDGTTDTVSGTLNGSDDNVWKADRQNTVETTYSFSTQAEGVSNVIDTVAINFRPEVQEGEDIQAWKDEVQILTGADEYITVNPRIDYYEQADSIMAPLGYDTQKFGLFMKGVQRGFTAEVQIPDGLDLTFADTLTVIVNGDDSFTCEINKTSKFAYISLYDVFDITGEADIEPAPVVNLEYGYMAVGQTINVEELVSTDANVVISLKHDNSGEQYYTAYPETNNLTADKVYDGIGVYIDIWVDANHDGIYESNVGGRTDLMIYATPEEIPDLDTMIVSVTELNPAGEIVYTGKRYFDQGSENKFSIPEIEDAFITDIEASEGEYYLSQGAGLISQSAVNSNRSITVHSVAADSLTVAPGADEVYAYFDNLNVKNLYVSIDGVHFYTGSVKDLTPDTEYMLYYKQGMNGTVYNKSFRTAGTSYGVYVGMTTVTDQNTGNLEKDGWHYDTERNILTIKNLTMESAGATAEMLDWFGAQFPVYCGAIASKGDLTVELIGDNTLEKYNSDGLYQAVIYTGGNLTLTGGGNLTLTGTGGINSRGIFSMGNVTLGSTGVVDFIHCLNGIGMDDYNNCSVTYQNGEYIYRPDYYYNSMYIGSLMDSRCNLVMSGIHALTATIGYSPENLDSQTVAAEDIKTAMQGGIKDSNNSCFLHVKPVHSCTKKVQVAEYYVEGDCEEGATYYKSCACGYSDHQSTFIVGGQTHDYVYYDAKEATCTEDGWKAYKVCTKCGDTDFEAVTATGHVMTHYNAKEATCTEAGWNEYDECSVCGMSTYTEIPAIGHTLVHHEGQEATCTAVGWNAYDTCENCDYTTYSEIPMKEHSLVHHEGKEATTNESGWEAYDECENCDYNTYKIIPIIGTADEGTWKKDSNGWWYKLADGTYPKNQWKKIDGKWYHFDKNGYMQTGWYKEGTTYYYLKTNGVLASDEWVEDDKYYIDAGGKWVKGKTKDDTQTGTWKHDSKGWWYQNADGTYPKNQWKKIDDNWYHFDENGYMQTGWYQEGSDYYYLKSNGVLASDEWVENDKYYIDTNGKWVKGKTKVTEGWKHDSKGWWYQNADGTYPMNAWKKINEKWYHFGADGYMQTGWYQEGSDYYYLKSNGVLASDEWVEDDKYYIDANGKWVKGKTKDDTQTGTWKHDSKGWWYQNTDGTYPKNQWMKIDGKWYHFDENGYMQTGWYKENDYYYYLKANGVMASDEWVEDGKYYVDSNGHWVKDAVLN